jgi:hypothetical protein
MLAKTIDANIVGSWLTCICVSGFLATDNSISTGKNSFIHPLGSDRTPTCGQLSHSFTAHHAVSCSNEPFFCDRQLPTHRKEFLPENKNFSPVYMVLMLFAANNEQEFIFPQNHTSGIVAQLEGVRIISEGIFYDTNEFSF